MLAHAVGLAEADDLLEFGGATGRTSTMIASHQRGQRSAPTPPGPTGGLRHSIALEPAAFLDDVRSVFGDDL